MTQNGRMQVSGETSWFDSSLNIGIIIKRLYIMGQPTETKQWVTKQDGIEYLEQEIVPLPKLADGEVLVKILAVSLN